MSQFVEGKIEVTSPEHSVYVQQKLFDLGYHWGGGLKTPRYTDARFIFIDRHGCITYELDDEEYFKNKNCEQFDYPMPSKTDSLNLAGCVFKFPEDETKSKELQEYLFSQGYYWCVSGKSVIKTSGNFIKFWSNGEISFSVGSIKPTHNLDLKISYSLSVEKLAETVVVAGKTFLKSDYEAFLEKAIND